jgi:hypothetical protein
MDASDFATDAILYQKEANIQPVAFYSRTMRLTEFNYTIHDKEILAIISTFKEWRRYFEGTENLIVIFVNHKNLEYFIINRILNYCYIRLA